MKGQPFVGGSIPFHMRMRKYNETAIIKHDNKNVVIFKYGNFTIIKKKERDG